MATALHQFLSLNPNTYSSPAGSAAGINDLLVAQQFTGSNWLRAMQGEGVLTFIL